MRAVAQRVTGAELKVDGKLISAIGKGLVVFFGVTHGDTEEKADYIAKKIANLRVFEDENGKMNRSVRDENGEVLFVSQFTLYGRRFARQPPVFHGGCARRSGGTVVRSCGRSAEKSRRSRKKRRVRRGYENNADERRPRNYLVGNITMTISVAILL